jgi:hypothetical protein
MVPIAHYIVLNNMKNSEMEKMWEEAYTALFKIPSKHFLELRKATKTVSG